MAGLTFWAFLMGLVIGSFLNVCIWRLPRDGQVVRGRSRCPACHRTIAWYDNIPLVSFALLGGRCRGCRRRISWRYPAVELMTGIACAAVVARWGMTIPAFIYGALLCGLIVVSWIDAREQIIPDVITVPGLGLGVLASVAWPALHGTLHRGAALGAGLMGAAVGGGSIWLLGWLGTLAFKKEAMGQGDVKLMAMLGAFLGWQRILLTFFLAPILGSFVGIPLKFLKGREIIPYGPFLSIAAVIALGWGDPLMHWYFRAFGGR